MNASNIYVCTEGCSETFTEHVEWLAHEANHLRSDLERITEDRNLGKRMFDDLELERDSLRSDLEAARSLEASFRSANDENYRLRCEAEAEVGRLRARGEQIQVLANDRYDEVKRLRIKAAEYETTALHLKEERAEAERLRELAEQYLQERDWAQAEVERLRATCDEYGLKLGHQEAEVERLRARLGQTVNVRLQAEVERLRAENENEKRIVSDLVLQVQQAEAEVERLRAFEVAVRDFWVYIDGAPILDVRQALSQQSEETP